jgi:hypothetical protein
MRIRAGGYCLALLAAIGLCPQPAAAQRNANSCYATPAGRLVARSFAPAEAREVVILIDKTVDYPAHVVRHVETQVLRLSRPGYRITIGSFSTDSRNTFSAIHASLLFEAAIPESIRGNLPRRSRDSVERCLLSARVVGLGQVRAILSDQFSEARPSIPRTHLMSSLRLFSQRMRASRAPRRTLIVISDMLENSDTSQFYASGRPRSIDPAAELRRARAANVIAALPGVDVYVIGLAIIPAQQRYVQNDGIVRRLERFWQDYFRAAGASSVTFGRPLLVNDIP